MENTVEEHKKEDFCSYCQYCNISDVYYCPECDDEEQDLYCQQLGKSVYEGLCWNEIAARHRRSDGKICGLDIIPDICPMKHLKPRPGQCAPEEEQPAPPVFHPHAGEMSGLYLYDPSGILLGQVRTEEELLDFLMQVKATGMKGYYVTDHGAKKEISESGTIKPPINSFISDALEYLVFH